MRHFIIGLLIVWILPGLWNISPLMGAVEKEGFPVLNNGEPFRDQSGGEDAPPFVPGRVIVKTIVAPESLVPFNRTDAGGQARTASGEAIRRILSRNYRDAIRDIKPVLDGSHYIVFARPGISETELARTLKNDPLVADASLNYIAQIAGPAPAGETVFPDDPYFQYQYGLHNSGQVYLPARNNKGKDDSDVDAPEGWAWTTGSNDMLIAILDTGVSAGHEDLNLKSGKGYNFVSDSEDTMDDHGHGTFVAAIAAAESNSGLGMAGVCWRCRILPVKVLKSDGKGDYLAIAAGIRYAADQGARVINMSLSGPAPSFLLEDACAYAWKKGCVIVAASGNEGAEVRYPAAYDNYCLAVSACDDKDIWGDFSNHGPQVDVAAPGVWIFSAHFDPANPTKMNGYAWSSGTSHAAPFVAGAAALLLSYKPDLTPSEVMDLIRYTADDVNGADHPGVDEYIGYGRLNIGTLLSPFLVR